MPPKATAGSGFAAARDKLGKAASTSKAGKQQSTSGLDDDLANSWALPFPRGGAAAGSSVGTAQEVDSITLSTALTEKVERSAHADITRELLGALAYSSSTVRFSLLQWSEDDVSLLRADEAFEEPTIVQLGPTATVRAEIARTTALGTQCRVLPTALTPVLVREPLAAVRCSLPGGFWRTLEPSRSAEDASLMLSWSARLHQYLVASPSQAKLAEPLVHRVIIEV